MSNGEALAVVGRWFELVSGFYSAHLAASSDRARIFEHWISEFRQTTDRVARLCVAHNLPDELLVQTGRSVGFDITQNRPIGVTTDDLDSCCNLVSRLKLRLEIPTNPPARKEKKRGRGRPPGVTEETEIIQGRLADGATYEQLADEFDKSPEAIRSIDRRKDDGVPLIEGKPPVNKSN